MKKEKQNGKVGYLIGSFLSLSLIQKVVAFSINQFVILHVSPEVYGQWTIQCGFIVSTVLFLSRESMRNALIRFQSVDWTKPKVVSEFVSLCWIEVFLSILISILIILYNTFSTTNLPPGLLTAFCLYCLGAILECLVEPWYNAHLNLLNSSPKLAAEIISALTKAVTTALLVYYTDLGIVCFGVGRVVSGVTIILVYWYFSIQLPSFPFFPLFSFFSLPSSPTLRLAISYSGQSVVKHMVTEADKLVLMVGGAYRDMGVYGLASHYGSISARLLLSPVEAASRIIFSKDSATSSSSSHSSSSNGSGGGDWGMFELFLKAMVYLGVLMLLFGHFLSPHFVDLYLSEEWKIGGTMTLTLQTYCFYVLFMAVNGISEAFLFSKVSSSQIAAMNGGLLLSTLLSFLSCAPLYSTYGGQGIVMMNCLAMGGRIIFNFYQIKKVVLPSSYPLSKLILNSTPSLPPTLILFISSLLLNYLNMAHYEDMVGLGVLYRCFLLVGVSGVVGVSILLSIYFGDNSFSLNLYHTIVKSKKE